MHLHYCIKWLIKSGQVNLCWWLEVGISATGKQIILGGTSCSCLNNYLCLHSHSVNRLNQTFLGKEGECPEQVTEIIKEKHFPSSSSRSKIGKLFELIIQNSKYSQRAVICCQITFKSQSSRLSSWTESCFLGENSSALAFQYFPGGVFVILFQLFLVLFYNSVFVLWSVLFWVLVKASCHFPCPSPWFDIFCQLSALKPFFPHFSPCNEILLPSNHCSGKSEFIPEKFSKCCGFCYQGRKDQKERW